MHFLHAIIICQITLKIALFVLTNYIFAINILFSMVSNGYIIHFIIYYSNLFVIIILSIYNILHDFSISSKGKNIHLKDTKRPYNMGWQIQWIQKECVIINRAEKLTVYLTDRCTIKLKWRVIRKFDGYNSVKRLQYNQSDG